MSTQLKLIAGLAAALVVAVVGYNLLPRSPSVGNQGTPTPVAPTSAPTAAPSPTPRAAGRELPDGPLTAGRYRITAYGIPIDFEVPADIPSGWVGDPSPFLASGRGFEPPTVLIAVMKPEGLFSDPCQWDLDDDGLMGPGDVEVGPAVDDLVAALRANTSYTTSNPSPVTFGAVSGTELELQLPAADVLATCDNEGTEDGGSYFVFAGAESGGVYAQGPDNRWRLSIVDVAGTRLVVLLSYYASTPMADVDAARAIVASFEFQP